MEELNELITMWDQYPDPSLALDMAFSHSNSPQTPPATRRWVYNTFKHSCCVRLSYVFNQSTCHKITPLYIHRTGVEAVTGKGGQYIFNVNAFQKYLKYRYGNPKCSWSNGYNHTTKTAQTRQELNTELASKKGIIIFYLPFGTGYDHADLWYSGNTGSYNLFDDADKIEFWEATY